MAFRPRRKKSISIPMGINANPSSAVEYLPASQRNQDMGIVASAVSQGEVLQTLAMVAFGGLGAISQMVENGEIGDVNQCADPESVIFSGLWTDNDMAYRNYYLSLIAGYLLRTEGQHRDRKRRGHDEVSQQYGSLHDILAYGPMTYGSELLSRVQVHTSRVLGEQSKEALQEQERQTRIIGSVLARIQEHTSVPIQHNG